MNSKKPIFYSATELFDNYPTISERGWTVEDIEVWVNQDIIIGRFSDDDKKDVLVEKESIEAFLIYHNHHLLERSRRVNEGIQEAKSNSSNPKI